MPNLGFDYFYGREADLFTFYRVPKLLFTDERFKGLSCEAKLAYGLMLDRMSLSVRNRWLDKEGRVYIVYGAEELADMLGCSRAKIFELMGELDVNGGVGLIERKRYGLGKPSRIYVKNIFVEKEIAAEENPDAGDAAGNQKVTRPECVECKADRGAGENSASGLEERPEEENVTTVTINDEKMVTDFQKSRIWTNGSIGDVTTKNGNNSGKSGNTSVTKIPQKSRIWTSRSPESRLSEVQNLDTNNTDISDTDISDTECYHNLKAGSKVVTSNQSYPYQSYQGEPVTTFSPDATSPDDDPMEQAEADVRERIEYDTIIQGRPMDKDRIDEIVYALAEIEISGQSTFRISGERIRASTVRNRLRKIDAGMVEYVLDSLDDSPTLIRNPKKYLLKCLYDAPTTVGTYYTNRARCDMRSPDG